MTILDACPTSQSDELDWEELRNSYSFIDILFNCPQDAKYHAEGDVGTHTRMACDALFEAEPFWALPVEDRRIVFGAVLLHDVAKPACTKHEDHGITSRGHSRRGDVQARSILWRQGVPFQQRESICALILHHQVPFFLIERPDSEKLAFRTSQKTRNDLLALVAWADGTGRRCADPNDQKRIIDNVSLFSEYCADRSCLTEPRNFPSDHSRVLYFRKEDRDPNYLAHDDTRCEATLMSGLPGAGKDTWITNNRPDLPVISLDNIRSELNIKPTDNQSNVIGAAREQAKDHLRNNQSFIWNATNLSSDIREQLLTLFYKYNASAKLCYVEANETTIRQRNATRDRPVPNDAIDRMLARWTMPSKADFHSIDISISETAKNRRTK